MRALVTMVMPLMLVASAAAQDSDAAAIPAVAASAIPLADAADMETEIDGGMASYYGNELAGNRTASGERFDPGQLTAAHRTLPFGSKVRVTNMTTGDSVIVRINDRGPFAHGRVIDVSHAAAREIGMQRSGTARVKLALLNDD
ncbi:septal ring lytic transglycosylase RlpA family protein [Sphingopyxis sp. PAMC25046]|uniref:septal ring lytic transglycosylase RlpA family protein n=1 Tax=Sphingopyxis sp. PAMC25046 TaxID=2565556 RepID=UPI00109DE989|nr:septal ring lytic transglycosylase RlpA family protein [Sphingopyxis sp. PAMC25046]QCB56541.1 septal ring lytic transglycosylase RlpA family protein [Sphingopyxis sp. PAMC25046]